MIYGLVGPLTIVANYRFLSSNMFANDWHFYDSCALNMSGFTSVHPKSSSIVDLFFCKI